MNRAKNFLLLVAACALMSFNARAAIITWGLPQNITGDSDVSTSGTLFQAANVGDGGVPSTTINGVTFSPFVMSGFDITSGNFRLIGASGLLGYSLYGVGAAPFTGLSSAYQSLLTYGNYTSGNALMTLTATNLSIGTTYQFQWWSSDSRAAFTQVEDATAGNTVTLDGNTTDASGGIGQFALGTFVADATSQNIDFQGLTGSATMQNAYQLRDLTAVPEPASASLLILGAIALVGRRRR